MRTFATVAFSAIAGFLVCAVLAYAGVELLSSNTHDRGLEAAMTAIFVGGPVGAIAGGIVGIVVARRSRRGPEA
jgi:hypothetical protein